MIPTVKKGEGRTTASYMYCALPVRITSSYPLPLEERHSHKPLHIKKGHTQLILTIIIIEILEEPEKINLGVSGVPDVLKGGNPVAD
jgi:hypothetical protein